MSTSKGGTDSMKKGKYGNCGICGNPLESLFCTTPVCEMCCKSNRCTVALYCEAKRRGLV